MKQGIFIYGPSSKEKTEIVSLVKDFFLNSEEIIHVFDNDELVEEDCFSVYIALDNKSAHKSRNMYKNVFNLSRIRDTVIAGQIIVNYIAVCRENKIAFEQSY